MSATREISHCYAPSSIWTCLAHPDDPHKTLVDEQGSLLYGFVNSIPSEGDFWFNRIFSFGLKTSAGPARVSQSTESARHPFVKTIIEYPNATLELLAFSHDDEGKRTDIVIWKVIAGEDETSVDTALWIDGQDLGRVFVLPEEMQSGQRVYATDAKKWRHIQGDFLVSAYKDMDPPATEPQHDIAYLSAPHELVMSAGRQFGPVPRLQTRQFTVTAGNPVQGAIVFPVNHALEADCDLDWAKQALIKERQFWTQYPLQTVGWNLPDNNLMDMVTASARNIMQARELKDGLPEFQVGPTCYRGLWVVDGHFILEAARYMGHDSAGKQGIDALLRRAKPDGSIMQLPDHEKETGISIASLIRQCEFGDDRERLASLWPVIQDAVTYIRALREKSRQAGIDAPEYNLMPATFADGGLGGVRPEYTTTLWTLVGLKKAFEAARMLGYDEDAQSFEAEFQDLLSVFRDKAARDMQLLPDGTPYLPMCMPNASSEHIQEQDFKGAVSPYYRVNPGTATWALAHAIYPGEIFAPDDPIVENFCQLLDLIDDEEGVPANTGWLPHNAVWNYAASFYAHVWLYAGRPDKAIDYLYSFANHASPTRVWREEQSLRSASYEQIVGDMPHNWASAEFIRLTRHLLVFERGGQLELLPALPPEWVKPNNTISLDNTPTGYGEVSLSLTLDEAGTGVLNLAFETGRSQQPDAVVLHLPEGFTRVESDGCDIPEIAKGQYRIPFLASQLIRLLR